jgi:hypothetical protein
LDAGDLVGRFRVRTGRDFSKTSALVFAGQHFLHF